MNALTKAQFEYDNRLPVEQEEDSAVTEWIERAANQLMDGQDVTWGYKASQCGKITPDEFYTELQLHLNKRQEDGEDQRDAFARLVAGVLTWGRGMDAREQAEYLVGGRHKLKELAVKLVEPHAANAVQLDREWMIEAEEAGF